MKVFKQKNIKNGGFTLVETLVAIAIFTVSLLGIMSVLGSGIASTIHAKQKMAATYLAQEGIECLRNTRDNYVLYTASTGLDWNDFVNIDVSDVDCPPFDPSFTRTLSIDQLSPNEVKIFSKISWIQGSGTYEMTFSENLFNWVE